MVLFAIQHVVFLIYNQHELTGISNALVLESFYHALSLDLSSSAYLILLPSVLFISGMFQLNCSVNEKLIHWFNISLIIVCILIGLFDTGLYSIWGTKINGKALSYLRYPKEAITAMAAVPYGWFLLTIGIQCFAAVFIYTKLLKFRILNEAKTWIKFCFALILLSLSFIAIRGGIQKYPLSKSRAYYSKYAVLNYSAMNGFWNFMQIILEPDIETNPYKYFEKSKADSVFASMHAVALDSTEHILTTERPNIVLILMESVSGECFEHLNGLKDVTPGLDSLAKESLVFTRFYANGFRTEQGIIACLSGFPAQPKTTIMRNFGKFDRLPNLARMLGDTGYSLNYYYAGNVEFAKTDAYLRSSGFTHILDKFNYPWKEFTDWGAYDQELFACHLDNAEKDRQPFFSVIMTSTNHEPFNGEVETIFKGNKPSDRYNNTVHYTDKCISEYIKQASQKPWFKNTLFVITSDHAHSMPFNRLANNDERHHIPLILFGDVLKSEYRGKKIEKIGSQIDLPSALLSQLGLPYRQFIRSKNLLNKWSPEFAYYTFDNGFGIITKEQTIIYDENAKMVVSRKYKSTPFDDDIIVKGKAYLQHMMEEFVNLNN